MQNMKNVEKNVAFDPNHLEPSKDRYNREYKPSVIATFYNKMLLSPLLGLIGSDCKPIQF